MGLAEGQPISRAVAEGYAAAIDDTGGELNDAADGEADGGEALGDEAAPESGDFAMFIEADDIDGEAHAEGVDAGGLRDIQSPAPCLKGLLPRRPNRRPKEVSAHGNAMADDAFH